MRGMRPDVAGECGGPEFTPAAEHPTGGEAGRKPLDLVLDHRLPIRPQIRQLAPKARRWLDEPTHGAVERLVELALEEPDSAELENILPLAAAAVDRQQLMSSRQGVADVAV